MEAVYLLLAMTICFGAGSACGYGFRSLIAKHIAEAKADAKAELEKVKAEFQKLTSEAKAKM